MGSKRGEEGGLGLFLELGSLSLRASSLFFVFCTEGGIHVSLDARLAT